MVASLNFLLFLVLCLTDTRRAAWSPRVWNARVCNGQRSERKLRGILESSRIWSSLRVSLWRTQNRCVPVLSLDILWAMNKRFLGIIIFLGLLFMECIRTVVCVYILSRRENFSRLSYPATKSRNDYRVLVFSGCEHELLWCWEDVADF